MSDTTDKEQQDAPATESETMGAEADAPAETTAPGRTEGEGPGEGPGVEPDRPPTVALAVWAVATGVVVVILVVVVIQLFNLWSTHELESKAATDQIQLQALRSRDAQRLANIDETMTAMAGNPALLGPVPAPGDEEGTGAPAPEGTGDAPPGEMPAPSPEEP